MNTPISSGMRFIEVATGEYGLDFQTVKKSNNDIDNLDNPTVEQLLSYGFARVHPTTPPVGDVVTEVTPQKDAEGRYQQAFMVRPFTPFELVNNLVNEKAKLHELISKKKNDALNMGAPINFGTGYGIQHVQMRDGDRANVLGLRMEAEKIIAENTDTMMGIRTYENNIVPVTAAQMVDIGWQVLKAYKGVMGTAWHFEDQLNRAESIHELPFLPESFIAQEAIELKLAEPPSA